MKNIILLLALLVTKTALGAAFPFSYWKSGCVPYATGGTITVDGDYNVHTFTSSGTFTLSGCPISADLLVVGGGGPGGGSTAAAGFSGGGGGGGGGVCDQVGRSISPGSYSVTVGASQAGGLGLNGRDSVFDTITAKGGGWGGTSNVSYGNGAANGGGSGGGGAPNANSSAAAVAGASTQSNSGGASCYGFAGGADPFTGVLPGGGGGGAGGVGIAGSGSQSGNGGPGFLSNISGSSVYYGCGGGSGGGGGNSLLKGAGGCASAGNGGDNSNAATSGAANSGGGGGGVSVNASSNPGSGGSGVVIVKVKRPPFAILNSSDKSSCASLSNGNRTMTATSSAWCSARADVGKSSGKFYWEVKVTANNAALNGIVIGVSTGGSLPIGGNGNFTNAYGYYSFNGNRLDGTTAAPYHTSYTTNDIVGVALDLDAGSIRFYKNGTWPGANAYNSGITGTVYPIVDAYGTDAVQVNFGQEPFVYTPPSGYTAGWPK